MDELATGRQAAFGRIVLPYGDRELAVDVPAGSLQGVFSPHPVTSCPDPRAELRRALQSPIGAPALAEAARGARRVVIVADDLTRLTPVDLMIPELLDDLNAAGVQDEQVTVLIALGTHRPMTTDEIEVRFGPAVTRRVPVINSPWQDPAQLVDLGVTPNGTPVHVSRIGAEADFLIGLGRIVPHHISGYSGGAKIIQPGISGPETTGATHLLSSRADRSRLGVLENPLRAEMEAIADQVGLKAVLNCVLDHTGRLVRAFYGDPRIAFRAGNGLSREVYGVRIPAQADVVVAGSHPCDIEFWQAHKTLYAAELVVKEGGTIIVVAPCPEGVTVTHQDLLNYASLDADKILSLIEDGTISDMVSGALALAWAKVRRRADVYLVSDGISIEDARALGFMHFPSLEDALAAALRHHGPDASVSALTHAPEMLPIIVS